MERVLEWSLLILDDLFEAPRSESIAEGARRFYNERCDGLRESAALELCLAADLALGAIEAQLDGNGGDVSLAFLAAKQNHESLLKQLTK